MHKDINQGNKKNSKKFLIFYYDLNNRPVQEYWLHVHIISDSEIL